MTVKDFQTKALSEWQAMTPDERDLAIINLLTQIEILRLACGLRSALTAEKQ